MPGWSLLRRSNHTDGKRLQALPWRFAWPSGVEHHQQQLQGEITSHPGYLFWFYFPAFIHSVVSDSLKSGVLGRLVVLAGGGEGAQWPAVPEATDLAWWAAETGGWCGGVSRGGYWSQRSSSGINRHRRTDWYDCDANESECGKT